jgi:hypothetical protein
LADITEVNAFHEGFLLCRDKKTAPCLTRTADQKRAGIRADAFLVPAVRLTRPKFVNDQRLNEDRALSDEACLKTRPGDQRAE